MFRAVMISFMFFACRSKSFEAEEDEDPVGDERNFSATARDIRESDEGMRDEGMGLLEEIKEDILKEEEKAEVEMKKSNYKRLGTWSNITITSSFVQNSEEAPPLSPAEGKVKMLEVRMMMEEMERMVDKLEEEMRQLQMNVHMDMLSLVNLVS